ncbi:MAG TPA: DUF983 domain-containing protein [Gemmatimonadaceae bacterium]
MTQAPSSLTTKCVRAVRLKCPRCGGRDIVATWFALRDRCPTCSLSLNRGEGDYWLGAYAINVVASEAAAAFGGLGVLALFWPATRAASITAIVLAVTLPVAFFPFARALWLAIDLHFRPGEPGDDPPPGA